MKLIITIILFALNLFFNYTNTSAQQKRQITSNQTNSIVSFNDFPCYAVTGGNAFANELFEYFPATNSWEQIGFTGTSNIDAIAIYSMPTQADSGIILATNGGTFGFIDQDTGLFSSIGEVGTGNGELGEVNLNKIDGLTIDIANEILYATHRIGGVGPGTNDLLLQIDIATGEVVKGAMEDSNGNYVDYVIIDQVFDGTFGADVYDVEDIAWNPYTGQLFALHNQSSSGVITELDPYTGQLDAVINDLGEDIMGGMAVSSFGELLLTTQSAAGELCISNGFLNFAGPPGSNPFCYDGLSKVEAFDCSPAINDLAISLELVPGIQEPVTSGSEITFLIIVENQGLLDNSDITLVNYTPEGLTLSDPNWIDTGNGNAYTTINEIISTGTSSTLSVTFVVNADFIGQTITNITEIVSSFNDDITDPNGNPIPLPDIDSNPDDNKNNDAEDCINCEPWEIEYEDDYAVVSIVVEQVDNLPILLSNIQPENCTALGSATIQLLAGGTPPFTHRWENLAGEMVHNQTNSNQQYQVPNLEAGGYYVTITDAANKVNTFSALIPFIAPLNGNTNCNNACPEYAIVPNGSVSGNFIAEQLIEIKGCVEQTATALFDICD